MHLCPREDQLINSFHVFFMVKVSGIIKITFAYRVKETT